MLSRVSAPGHYPSTVPPNPLLDPHARLVVGHRGAPAHAPENTLESFALALEQGADALETDVHLTADGAVVAIHDPTVDRTTDGAGAVRGMTLAALRALDAGARWTRDGATFPWRGRGVRVPTLDELLEAFPGVGLLVDAKSAAVAAPLRLVLDRHRAHGRVVVGSFDRRNLTYFRDGGCRRIATRDDVLRLLARALVGLPRTAPDYDVVAMPYRLGRLALPIGRLARTARGLGRALHLWTVNDPGVARALWAAGANGLVGDDAAMLVAARASAPG